MTNTMGDTVRSVLARELKRDAATLEPHHRLREDLGLNSLDAIELMFKVEEEFDLVIPDDDLQSLATVGDLIAYLSARHGTSGAPASRPAPTPAAARPAGAPARPAPIPPASGTTDGAARPAARKAGRAKGRGRNA
jgi:acyl carrier protein